MKRMFVVYETLLSNFTLLSWVSALIFFLRLSVCLTFRRCSQIRQATNRNRQLPTQPAMMIHVFLATWSSFFDLIATRHSLYAFMSSSLKRTSGQRRPSENNEYYNTLNLWSEKSTSTVGFTANFSNRKLVYTII